MNNFRRRVEGEIKLVSTTYTISSVKNKNIVIINPNQQFTIHYHDLLNEYRINRVLSDYRQNPYICVTCDVVFTKKETYSDGSIKTKTINASFTTTNYNTGAIPSYNIDSNGNIRTWSSLSFNFSSPSVSEEDKLKCTIVVELTNVDIVINTSSPVGTVGSGSFNVVIHGSTDISNYRTKYSFGVVNTTITKISDTTFLEVLST